MSNKDTEMSVVESDQRRDAILLKMLNTPPTPHSECRSPRENKKSKKFYSSPEWVKLRYEVILKYGRTCMCCKADDQPIHVDHIKPRSKYPELALEFDNLQILCRDCNFGKGTWDETDWREMYLKRVNTP